MPLYEFECTECGQRFERILRFTDPLPESCPQCGGRPRKLMSAPAFQFKGTGWYVTDYARKGAPGGESEAPKAESKGDSKAETESESKSESKPSESKPAATTSKKDE